MEENKTSTELIETTQEDKYIRLYADFENYKKRVAKEKIELVNNTKYSVLNSLLDIDNDLYIAYANIKDVDTKNVIEKMLSKIEKCLNVNGIYSIPTDKYNPDIHDVVSATSENSDNILSVVSKGYRINDKIIKHPKVILG